MDPSCLPVHTMVRALLGGAVQFRTHLRQRAVTVSTGSAVPTRAVQVTISLHPGHCYGCRRSLWLWSLLGVDTTQYGACGLTSPMPPAGLLSSVRPRHPVGTAFVRDVVRHFAARLRSACEPAVFGMREKTWSGGPSRGVGFSCPQCYYEVSQRSSARALASAPIEVFTTAIQVADVLPPPTPHWCLNHGYGHCPDYCGGLKLLRCLDGLPRRIASV